MKLSGAASARFFNQPDPSLAGALIYGPDPVAVSERRARLGRFLLGEQEGSDLRLTRISAADLRRDPAIATDAMKARGFFDGPQVVTVEDAGDGHSAALAAALAAASKDDAFLIVTAGGLSSRSKLRKLFESAPNVAAAAVYSDRIGIDDVRRMIVDQDGARATEEALGAIQTFGDSAGAGAVRDLVERLALYRLGDGGEIEAADVIACAAGAGEADFDGLIDAVILGRSGEMGSLLRRIESQGQSAISVSRVLAWRIRQLHSVLVNGRGSEAMISKLRPPVFGDRRATLLSATRLWTLGRVEGALRLSLELDDALRGAGGAGGFAIVERCLLKLALTAARQRRV